MKFSVYLSHQMVPEWRPHYIAFDQLKASLVPAAKGSSGLNFAALSQSEVGIQIPLGVITEQPGRMVSPSEEESHVERLAEIEMAKQDAEALKEFKEEAADREYEEEGDESLGQLPDLETTTSQMNMAHTPSTGWLLQGAAGQEKEKKTRKRDNGKMAFQVSWKDVSFFSSFFPLLFLFSSSLLFFLFFFLLSSSFQFSFHL